MRHPQRMTIVVLTVLAGAITAVPASAQSRSTTLVTSVWNARSTSRNWTGYDVSTSDVNFVTATWLVPTISCGPSENSDVSIWVGAGSGTNSDHLYQTGVGARCANGRPGYRAWWEVYPVNAEQEFTNRQVAPGDKVQAYVYPNAFV